MKSSRLAISAVREWFPYYLIISNGLLAITALCFRAPVIRWSLLANRINTAFPLTQSEITGNKFVKIKTNIKNVIKKGLSFGNSILDIMTMAFFFVLHLLHNCCKIIPQVWIRIIRHRACSNWKGGMIRPSNRWSGRYTWLSGDLSCLWSEKAQWMNVAQNRAWQYFFQICGHCLCYSKIAIQSMRFWLFPLLCYHKFLDWSRIKVTIISLTEVYWHMCVSKLGPQWFRWWLVACFDSLSDLYLAVMYVLVDIPALRNKLQRKFNSLEYKYSLFSRKFI